MSLYVNIKKEFRDFSLKVQFDSKKTRLGILGASGCGKSLTLKCIAGIEKPNEGIIVLNGKILYDSEKKINLSPQKRKVGYLFQNYALFPNMTVAQNIAAGLDTSINRGKKLHIVQEKIKMFHLEGLGHRYPAHLSGGQQQRVALARIFAYKPDVLMLDEPFSALDTYLKDQLQSQLLEVLSGYQGEVIMVTHSQDEIYRFCKELAIMNQGNIVLKGKTKEIFNIKQRKEMQNEINAFR